MMHPDTAVREIGGLGLGVVATADLPPGTLVWVRDPLDRVVPASEFERLPELVKQVGWIHAWSERERWYLTWDHGRYTNHSCDPNCAGLDVEFDIAIRAIAVGEQITNDYAWLGMAVSFECRCGAPSCRGAIREGERPPPGSPLVSAYREALSRVGRVPQPLAPLLGLADGVGFEALRQRCAAR